MDVIVMLADLRREKKEVEDALLVLERLASGRGKRRGRPPKWMIERKEGARRRGRPPGSKNKPKEGLARKENTA